MPTPDNSPPVAIVEHPVPIIEVTPPVQPKKTCKMECSRTCKKVGSFILAVLALTAFGLSLHYIPSCVFRGKCA